MGADEFDDAVFDVNLALSCVVYFDVSEVADHAFFVFGGSVVFTEGVEDSGAGG